jgi:hypothetical protein
MDQTVYDLDDIKLIVSVKDCKYSVMICCHDTCETTAWRRFTNAIDINFAAILIKFINNKTRDKLIYDLYYKLAGSNLIYISDYHSHSGNIFKVARFFGPLYETEKIKYYSNIHCEYCVKVYKNKSVIIQSIYIKQIKPTIEIGRGYCRYYSCDAALLLEREIRLSPTATERELHTSIYNAYWSIFVPSITKIIIKLQLFPEPLCNIIKNYLA